MKKWMLFSTVMFFSLALVLSGCAKKPEAELQKAESALSAAKDAGAQDLAAKDYQAAENKLNEGKSLVDKKKYKDAVPVLNDAASLADTARDKALVAKKTTTKPVAAAPAPAPAPATAPAFAPEKKADFADHKVVKGDCLWKIAASKDAFGDGYAWPLIYDANKDQIKNPNLIYPKQVLKVPVAPSEDELKAAEAKAGKKVMVKKAAKVAAPEATTEKKEAPKKSVKKATKKVTKKTTKEATPKAEMEKGATAK